MAELKTIIEGLEHCRKYGTLSGQNCNGHYERYTEDGQTIALVDEHRTQCPYGDCKTGCLVTLIDDALKLLKEQAKTKEDRQEEQKQKRREYQKKYRIAHKGKAYQTTKEWRKNNPEKWKAQQERWREKRKLKKLEKKANTNETV